MERIPSFPIRKLLIEEESSLKVIRLVARDSCPGWRSWPFEVQNVLKLGSALEKATLAL